ncbi:MAG: hypothetical protein VYE27_02495 [Pseudomonadota bacterium]|nr:hypothetical protein [Pseudomonadota bacterium]
MTKNIITFLTLSLAGCTSASTEKLVTAGQLITPFVVGTLAIKSVSSIDK